MGRLTNNFMANGRLLFMLNVSIHLTTTSIWVLSDRLASVKEQRKSIIVVDLQIFQEHMTVAQDSICL